MTNINSTPLPNPQELEINTAENWLSLGTIRITETGSENTYYADQFGIKYFCKNYPQPEPVKVPEWMDQDITPADVAAINQGGCESGAYMPSCEYYSASQTMSKYGDDVLQYLEDVTGELPVPPNNISWSQLACFYLSKAVELFCAINADLENWENEEPLRSAA